MKYSISWLNKGCWNFVKKYKSGKYTVHIDSTGTKLWEYKGYIHRENGPAWIWYSGDKEWFLNGEMHREDGPAIENNNGIKQWWLNDNPYTEKDWKIEMRKRKLKKIGL